MKHAFQILALFFLCFSPHLNYAKDLKCDKSAKPTGFTLVKSDKSYFYSEPSEKKKLKAYVVANDFLQVIGKSEGAFTCVLFRNYNGYGGKQLAGWMLSDSLQPVRTKLERKDLLASWNKSPCSDDSCLVYIAEEKGKIEVGLTSYLHDHPSESYTVGQVRESPGHWTLTNIEGSSMAPEKFEIEFDKTDEPGTIKLLGPEGWSGTYHR